MNHVVYPPRPAVEDETIALDQIDAAVASAITRIRRMTNEARLRIGGGLTPVDYPFDQWPIAVGASREDRV